MAQYRVTFMRAFGDPKEAVRMYKLAPSESVLAAYGRGRTGRWDLAIRYYPSRKGWMIIDLRNAHKKPLMSGHRGYWTGTRRSPKAYPNEDAAVMKAMYILNPPSQRELSL